MGGFGCCYEFYNDLVSERDGATAAAANGSGEGDSAAAPTANFYLSLGFGACYYYY